MKKIVILTERLPYPPTSGTKNLLYNYCKILHNDFGMEVVNISFKEDGDDVSLKPDFISKTYTLPNPSGTAKLKNLIVKTFIQQKYPMQVSLFWDEKVKKIIDKIVSREKPDYVIADYVRTTEYLKDHKGFKIADLQDLLSLRYSRQLEADLSTINPYGAYLFRLPKPIQSVLQVNWIKKCIMKTEVKLMRRFEKDVANYYDRVAFVAKQEGRRYDKMVGDKKSIVVPLGVNYEYFSEKVETEKLHHSIAFLGAMNVSHNEYGIIHFIKDIFPLVLKKVPDAKLYIIGGGATEQLKSLASDNVILTGRVDDVRVAISACDVFVCPLVFGSGIKNKNLESMAMGVPVVTTTIGAENIDAVDRQDWFVSDSNEDFADDVVKFLLDEKLREEIGKNGQTFVKNNFTWKQAEKAFHEVF